MKKFIKRKVAATSLLMCLLLPSVVYAAFPLALLPGITLLFDSGAMAVGYATAIALVGSALAWLYLSPSEPAPSQTPATKLEVRMKESEAANISRPSTVTYEDYGPGERHMYPPFTVTMPASFSNTNQYNTHVEQIQSAERCTVGKGCTQVVVVSGQFWRELSWAYQSSDRYLRVLTATNGTFKIDPHNVASRDGVTDSSFTVCPSGYEFSGGNRCQVEDIYSDWYLPSDGICSYTQDSNGRFIIEPAAYDAYRPNRIIDPDCYAKVTKTNKLEYDVNPNHKVTLEAVNSAAIKVTEEKTDSNTNRVDKSEYIIQKDGQGQDMKLTGGSYNNSLDNSSPGGGNNENGEGGAVCGANGLPPCEVDDSGFIGKDGFDSSEVDSKFQAQTDAIGSVESLNIDASIIPSLLPGTPVACHPIPISFTFRGWLSGFSINQGIDLCPHFDVLRSIFAYLFGISAVIYIWRRFSHANDGA